MKESNVSDEGNTSEYSHSPSSKSSTLESNPDLAIAMAHSHQRCSVRSDGSSDSESEDNLTIATQLDISANVNNVENKSDSEYNRID